MKRYVITGRGLLVAVTLPLAIILGTVALVSAVTRDEGSPSGHDLSLVSVTAPVTPSTPDTPSLSPGLTPSPPVTIPSPSPSPVTTPSPSPIPVLSPSPRPPSPTPPPTPNPPSPTPVTPHWTSGTAAVMFGFDSAVPGDFDLAAADLKALLPKPEEMTGWLIVCQGFSASDETAENLSALRAQAVADILLGELGLPEAQVRVQAAPPGSGNQRYRQRVDVYFTKAGSK